MKEDREDTWAVPRRTVDGRDREMEPYYTIMRLPNEQQDEFLLMLPLAPANRDNTVIRLLGTLERAKSSPPLSGADVTFSRV